MINPAVNEENDDLTNRIDDASNDENDASRKNSSPASPCHQFERSTTEPFSVESQSSADTFGFEDGYGSYTYRSPYLCCCCCNWLRRKVPALDHLRNNWKILALGQLISFSLAAGGAALATLNLDCQLSAPTFMVSLYYFLLAWHIVFLWKRRNEFRIENCNPSRVLSKRKRNRHQPLDTEESSPDLSLMADDKADSPLPYNDDPNDDPNDVREHKESSEDLQVSHTFFGLFPMHKPMWHYCMLAFIDVEANAITAFSFQYTTLTSITLFDNLAIPTAMVLSRCLFSRKYTWVHFGGVLICMVGVVVNMVQDYDDDQNIEEQQEYPHKLRGDLCAITGGILYGVSNVMAEVTLRDSNDSAEYLGIMGFFAFIFATIQAWIVEPNEILAFFGRDMELDGDGATCHTERWWMLAVYVGFTAFGYVGGSRFLQISEATFFALSLLTGDLWSVIFSIFFEHIIPHPLFFLALVFVLSGMVIYETAPSPVPEDRSVAEDEDATGPRGALPGSTSNVHTVPSIDYVSAIEDAEARNSISEGRLT